MAKTLYIPQAKSFYFTNQETGPKLCAEITPPHQRDIDVMLVEAPLKLCLWIPKSLDRERATLVDHYLTRVEFTAEGIEITYTDEEGN